MSRFHFVDVERASYPVNLLRRLLKVSRSGYYAWTGRKSSPRTLADEGLSLQMKGSYDASRRTYGSPRIWLDLRDAGVHVNRERVARRMRNTG